MRRVLPFIRFSLILVLLTALACPAFAEDIMTLLKKAKGGDARAQYNLGTMYANAQSVPQDYAEAVKWYRKAADQGYVEAQYNLGFKYFTGQGVSKDYVQSYFWYSLAASRSSGEDHKKFSDARDQAAKKLTPEKLLEAQQVTRDWEAKHPRK